MVWPFNVVPSVSMKRLLAPDYASTKASIDILAGQFPAKQTAAHSVPCTAQFTEGEDIGICATLREFFSPREVPLRNTGSSRIPMLFLLIDGCPSLLQVEDSL